MIARRKAPTIERKIHFYRISPIKDEDQVRFEDLVSAMNDIEGLDWVEDGRYLEVDEGNSVCLWCESTSPQIKLKLGTRRTRGLPDLETSGHLSPLEIDDNSGLSEITHMIIFRDNIIGSEFNFFGPRAQRLTSYLASRSNLVPIRIDPLIQKDVEEKLAKFQSIRLARLRFKRTDVALISEMDEGGLSRSFRAIGENLQAPVIDITFKNVSHSKIPLATEIFDSVKKIAGDIRSKEVLDKFKIKGFNEETLKIEELDLLGDYLISTREVIREGEKQRNINSESMYQAINESYTQLHDVITRAASMG